MNRFTKVLLGVAILNVVAGLLFVTGVINVDAAPGLYAIFPLGVVCTGVFFIFFAVEKETAMYDIEEWVHEIDLEKYNHSHADELHHGYGHHAPMHA